MATRREELQTKLEKILGSRNVYYQPPNGVKMGYPAIRYSLNDVQKTNADDAAYLKRREYQIIVIDRLPDNPAIEALLDLPYCSYERHYESDNLNHDVLTLYY